MTSKAYALGETPVAFSGVAGADVAFSIEGLADAAGRVSAQHTHVAADTTARSFKFKWAGFTQWQATPTQYGTLDLYIAEIDFGQSPIIVAGDVGVADAALGDVDQLRNLKYIGSIVVEDAATTVMKGTGYFETEFPAFCLVALNDGGAAINATDSNSNIIITPMTVQGQDT